MADKSEMKIKEQRLRSMMKAEKLDAVVLSNQNNFAWFTCGKDNHVVTAADGGVASIVVTADAKYIVTNNIEGARIMEEEVAEQGFELCESPWYQGAVAKDILKIIGKGKGASDNGIAGLPNIEGKIAPLRWELTKEEVERYRQLGKNAEKAMNKVCKSLKPGITEHEIAARLSLELYSMGITPHVLLIAADERISKYRHPINTDKKVTRYVMNVICARKWGLIVSCTRLVHFGALPPELKKKHEAVVRVDTAFNLNTKAGRPIYEIFNAGLKEYKATGYAEEWKLHHQGGPTGYAGRDFFGTADEKRKVLPNQAFAWNPSITGTKSEDTIIVTEKGIEWLSLSTDWPMIEIEYEGEKVKREGILVL